MATSSNALRAAAGLACVSMLYLAACSDSAITPPSRASSDGPSLTQNPDIAPANGRHEFGTKDWYKVNNGLHRGGGGGTGIFYHGGPVLQSGTKVVAVYWANNAIYNNGPTPGSTGAGSSDASLVGYFLNHLGGSPYFNINTTYTDGFGHAILNSVTYTSYWANNANVPANGANVSDSQMLSMLGNGFQSGAIAYDPSTLYIIFTAGTVNLGGGFGSQYCAYHGYGTAGGHTVKYSAMPYVYAYPSACTAGTTAANGDPGADYEVNVIGHETEETTTDELLNAWYDTRGYENADKCAWNFGSAYYTAVGGVANIKIGAVNGVGGKDFLVQQNWVNAGSGGCVQHWP